MYIMNPYAVYSSNQIEWFSKQKNRITLAADSYLTLAHLCLLKEKNPKKIVCMKKEKEMQERWILRDREGIHGGYGGCDNVMNWRIS